MRGTSHRGGPSHLFWRGGVTKGPWPGRCRAGSAALRGPGCPGVPQPSLGASPAAAFSSSPKTPVKAKAPIPRAVWYNYLCGGGSNRCTSADGSPNSADLLRALIRLPVPQTHSRAALCQWHTGTGCVAELEPVPRARGQRSCRLLGEGKPSTLRLSLSSI